MSDEAEAPRRPGGPERRVDAMAMGLFLEAMKRGASVEAAAAAAGFGVSSFYRRRRADPAFAAAWAEAMEISDAPMFIAPHNKRRLQLRRARRLKFGAAKKALFLAHFAGTCDLAAAAEAAGVCRTTVGNHRRSDPAFAAQCRDVLAQAYERLEEEAVRQRLEAQEKLREGVLPQGEISAEFERVLKLLAQWRRRDGSLGPRSVGRERREPCGFEEAMAALEKRLRALDIPIEGEEPPVLPSPGARDEDA